MMRSLFAGVSGLRNHQVRMDVIGNNIANVNTVAFKASRVTFKEGFAQLLQGASRPPGDHGGINPIQVGLGMQVGSIDQLFTQGNIETTGQVTDLAIQGDAMFVVSKGNQHFYTRSGNFQMDADGRLVSPTNGFVVQGRMATDGVLQEGITDIRLPFGQKTAARATTQVTLAGNVNAAASPFAGPFLTQELETAEATLDGATVDPANPIVYAAGVEVAFNNNTALSGDYRVIQDPNDATKVALYRNGNLVNSLVPDATTGIADFGDVSVQFTAPFPGGLGTDVNTAPELIYMRTATTTEAVNEKSYTSSTISMYDSLGTKHELKIWMYKEDPDTWAWTIDPSGLQGVTDVNADGKITVGNDPALHDVVVDGPMKFDFNDDGTLDTSGATWRLPAISFTPEGAKPVEMTMDPGSGVNGLTQFASANSAVLRDQDGYTMGDLQNFSIDRTGIITGAFTNGTSVTLGQIVLADFNNPGGLLRTGDNMYSVSGNSGQGVLGFALEGSQSFLTSGALEMSNVDLAQEFTNMIVTQRGFQANGRVITSSDEMLQEVVNLKR